MLIQHIWLKEINAPSGIRFIKLRNYNKIAGSYESRLSTLDVIPNYFLGSSFLG